MASQPDETQAVYRAWKDATDKYNDQVKKIFAGDPNAYAEIQPIIEALQEKHRAMMEASKPFQQGKN